MKGVVSELQGGHGDPSVANGIKGGPFQSEARAGQGRSPKSENSFSKAPIRFLSAYSETGNYVGAVTHFVACPRYALDRQKCVWSASDLQ